MQRIVILTIFFLSFAISAQHCSAQSLSGKLQYRGSASLGMLMGESSTALQVQTVHGIQFKNWQLGAGVAVDQYAYRTIPLLLEVKRMFPLKTHSLFASLSGGRNLLWLTTPQKQSLTMFGGTQFHAGWYGEAAAGYQFALGKKGNALDLGIGYSVKSFQTRTLDYSPIAYDAPPVYSDRRYTLGRIALRVGVEF